MKRLLTSAAMFLCCVATAFAQFSGSGSGTESDPYLILNPIQLNQLKNYLNQENVYFKLMADIPLTEYLEDESPTQGWQPVGNSSSAAFKGILDGNGKTITGLWIKRGSTDYVGLFGYTSGATIKNLTIVANTIVGKDNVGALSGYGENSTYTGVNITTTKIQGASNVGGLVGNTGDNMNLSDNTVVVVINATGDYVGGLIGRNDAGNNLSISGCQVNDSKITGNNYIGGACGGIIGNHGQTNNISTCYIHADITGNNNVGGICGYSANNWHTVNLTNCGYIGNIYGTKFIGGLIGYVGKGNNNVNIDSQNGCFAVGSIYGTSDYVAGLIGYDSGYYYRGFYCNDVTNCYFSGSISGRNYTAGLVGYKKYGTISKSYCSASVLGNQYVGGLLGYQESSTTLKTSVAINTRVYATEGDVNRIVGYNKGTIAVVGSTEENKSYNRTIIVSQGVAKDIEDDLLNGTGVSLSTLKLKATYVAMGWDFTNTWAIQETECHPYMKTQTAPPVITSSITSGATVVSGKCVDGGKVILEIDGVKQQMVSSGHNFSFNVSPLQAGHEVRLSAKADGKEQSYYTTELVSFLGKGTEADPYQVYTAADLTCVYRRGYYKQMNDIDLADYINQFSPTEGWKSIGRDGSETIHYDGAGHKVTGLWCNSTRDNTGLFSCFANGTIKNLTVETAKNKQVKGGANTGIIIGKMMNGTITNCRVSGTVADGTPVGGIVGLFDGGAISNCQAKVTINTTLNTSYVGGLVGETTGGTIDQCFTEGTLTATGDESYVGGIVGKNIATLTNSYSTATITSSYNAAGVVAYNYGLVDKCYATGNLFSNNYAAGVIGYNDGENAIVSNCAAMSNKIEVIYESQQQQQGGGYGMRIIGGFKNDAPAPEMNNYALKTMQVSLNDVPQKVYDDIMNGTAKTTAELTMKSTYQELDWDFTNIWKISEGAGYPYLNGTSQVIPDDPGQGGDDPNPDDPEPVDDPDTDISSMNNVIYLNKVEANADSQINLSIRMKNAAAIRGFQFDLYLPDGVTVVKSAKGKIVGSLSEGRLPEDDEHTLTLSEQSDGAIRFLCGSLYDETFTGNDGEIATLSVKIAEDMADGNYAIILKDIKMTETDINNYYQTERVKSTLTIKSYTLGDINGDGKIDVSDYIGIANHILGNAQEGFNVKAADVNEDGLIDVSDYIGVANIILTGSIYGTANNARTFLYEEDVEHEIDPE